MSAVVFRPNQPSGECPISNNAANETSSAGAPSRVVSLSGHVPYEEALALQYAAQTAVQSHAFPNTLYLLEHLPVVTIGRGAGSTDKDLITGRAALSARGITLLSVDRGGETTYHAPGQLVGYSIINLQDFGRDLHRYIRSLELIIVRALAVYNLSAGVKSGLTGVWIGDRKIAAIGIKVSRWVSMHGFSLNNDVDLSVMRRDIVPCGIADKGVISLRELGVVVSRTELEASIATAWSETLFGHSAYLPVKSTLDEELTQIASTVAEPGVAKVGRDKI